MCKYHPAIGARISARNVSFIIVSYALRAARAGHEPPVLAALQAKSWWL